MANLEGFWSYVHADDEADYGRIAQLARDVVSQFEMLTGEKISLFLDRDEIDWGDNWKQKIDNSLATVGFFVPVLTPRYFLRPECRRELQAFARLATDLGIKDLIMPLLYVDIPAIYEQNPQDELIQLVQTFQWNDWRELRFMATDSEGYRRGVADLAARLADANKSAEEISMAILPQPDNEETSEEEPGFVELLADFEEKLDQSPGTLAKIGEEITSFGNLMKNATAEIMKSSKYSQRLIITRKLTHQLREPTERIWALCNELSSQFHSMDNGYRAIIDHAPSEIATNSDAKKSFCTLFNSVRSMVASIHDGLQGVQAMIDATEPLDKMSREIRPVTRQLRQGLMLMMELNGLSQNWIGLIDASGIECDAVSASQFIGL